MASVLNILSQFDTDEPRPIVFDDPDWHRFDVDGVPGVFIADGSRVYSLSREIAEAFDIADSQRDLLSDFGISRMNAVSDVPLLEMPIRALSLAIAQKCNLGCTYCYAEGGSFGGEARNMTLDVARRSVDQLFANANSDESVNLSFLGGEPFTNRAVLREVTEYAVQIAKSRSVKLGLSVTTNGTLLTGEDADFLEQHGFAVTVSLDGVADTHDRLRSYKGGRGTYDHIMTRLQPLLQRQRSMQVSARVTVTPANLEIRKTLDEFISLGFHSVGFSPMLTAPNLKGQMQSEHLQEMLSQMIDCGRVFEQHVIDSHRYPFTNAVNAMRELHRGTHRPYPCGAGAGYFGVAADGKLYACHRFVEDPVGEMGDVDAGVNASTQSKWLSERHVHFQQPCNGCWARYLCGGGCHHEVIKRGRPACDFIRGWLHYSLQAYTRLREKAPEYFGQHVSVNAGTNDVHARL